MTTTEAYWLDGTPYCVACVEAASPCMSAAERERATVADGVGRCGCCGEVFETADDDATVEGE